MIAPRRKLSVFEALLAMLMAIALAVTPAFAAAGIEPCLDGPQVMDHVQPTVLTAHADRHDRVSAVSAVDLRVEGRHAKHGRDCCDLGCLGCTPFLVTAQELTDHLPLPVRYARSADSRGEGLAPSPMLGPPRIPG